jgi:hypothetical protein
VINQFFIVGEVKRIQVANREGRKPSAVMLVQYGRMRERTGGEVEFINASLIRVPNYLYPKVKDSLKEGAKCEVVGHIQGVVKNTMTTDGFISVELVADRIFFEGSDDDEATPE